MRFVTSLWIITLSVGGACMRPDDDVEPDAPAPDACTDCAITTCADKGMPDTAVTGRVLAPNGTLPLAGAIVYVPLSDPGPLPAGPHCDRCGDELPGGSLTQTATDARGRFRLPGVPAGTAFPLVVQLGAWRRQLVVAPAAACQDTALAEEATRLPRDRSEGDLPRIAVTTGDADALECLIRKLGISDTELTTADGDGRVHLYAGNGARTLAASLPHPGTMTDAQTLWGDPAKLAAYDIVVLSCEGAQRPWTKPQSALEAVHDYADAGGRVFMSHWHNIWLGGEAGHLAHGLADWQGVIDFDFAAPQRELTQTAMIDHANPRGETFAAWLAHVGATTGDTMTIHEPRYTAKRLQPGVQAQRWMYVDPARSTPLGKQSVQNVVFTTPVAATADERCGKVAFSDMHVSADSQSSAKAPFPTTCAAGDLTPQEKALAFILFDVAACVPTIL